MHSKITIMAAIIDRRTTFNNISQFGRNACALIFFLALFVCVGCSQHYCPTYASTSYNKSFTYVGEKTLTYKPVKVHEFKSIKVNKSEKEKKEKNTRVR